MINFKKFFLVFFSVFFLFNHTTQSNVLEKTRFIVMGHLYPILNNETAFKNLVAKVNSYNPDYLFILGDSEIQNKKIYNDYLKLFRNTKIYFSPGNHELAKSKEKYFENVGYFDLLLITKKAKFILINSSDDVNEIKIKLKNYLSEEFHAGPTILLTHHRIWDDTIISELPFQHDKSYYFDEIFPIIKDKINYIFSGNSKRQYFKDMSNSPYYGKQNINNIFWMDKIGNINAYSIGMGDAEPKANFTIVDIFEKNLMITGDYSSVNNFEILSRNLIEPNPVNFNKSDYEKKYFFIKKKSLFKYSLIVLAFFLLIIGYFIRNIKRSNFN